MKKALLFASAMLLGSVCSFAIEYPATFTEGGLTYRVQSQTAAGATITGYTADIPADLTIKTPITFDGKARTVEIQAVDGKSVLADAPVTSLTIDGNVKLIINAFNGVTSLTKLRFENYTNTQIGMNIFQDCTSLSDVVLPQSLTSIGQDCFNGCAIESIAIPAGVTEIKSDFKNCTKLAEITFAPNAKLEVLSLGNSTGNIIKSVDVPASVKQIYMRDMAQLETVNFLAEKVPANLLNSFCFMNCTSLKSINLPEGITTLPLYAFGGCTALETVNIPSTVTTIGSNAFSNCKALATIDAKAPQNWTTIGSSAFNGCAAFKGSLDLSGAKTIEASAFKDCGVTEVTLGESLTTVKGAAFMGSGLTSITLPSSLKKLDGTQVFQNCTNLAAVNFPATAGLASIPGKTFMSSGVTELLYPDYVTSVASDANSNCKSLKKLQFPANEGFTTVLSSATSNCGNIEEIVLPDNITTIEKSAFANNKINEVNFPANIKTIGANAFENNQIAAVEWPEQITVIPNNVFSKNQITDIEIPATVTEIGSLAFGNNPLASIKLNEGLKTINSSAFSSSSATYTTLEIPATVNTIGQYAFAYNNSFKHLTLLADEANDGSNKNFGMYAFGNTTTQLDDVTSWNTVPPTIQDNTFGNNTYKNAKLNVLDADVYKAATGWKNFGNNIITGIEGIEAEGVEAPVEWFNLQGVKVANPANGIFIRRQGNKVEKVQR